MWETLMQKVTVIVNTKYKDNNIKSTNRDDVVQEIMMYLFGNKQLAEQIYEKSEWGLLYRICCKVIYRLKSKEVFNDHSEYVRYKFVIKSCLDYDVEPVAENAYKIAAIIYNDPNISAVSKKSIYTIAAIIKLLELGNSAITECEFIER